MLLLVIALIMVGVIVGGYLVDRHDRKNGHQIGSGRELRARIRTARKLSRDRAWGSGGPARGQRRGERYPPPAPRGRRSN